MGWHWGALLDSHDNGDVPSLKLTAKAPENGWLEDDCFLFGFWPIFRGELLVSRSVFLCWHTRGNPGVPALEIIH